MKSFFRQSLIVILLVTIFLPLTAVGSTQAGLSSKGEKIKTKSGSFQIQTVKIPRNNPRLQFVPVTARDRIGYSESLAQLTKREKGLAAVNGTFFDAYTKFEGQRYPSGTIMKNSRMLHTMTHGATIGFGLEGEVGIERLRVRIQGYINGKFQWYAWRMNHPADDPEAIVLFTPEFSTGKVIQMGSKVIVKNGKVTSISQEKEVMIPRDGFVIYFGTGKYPPTLVERFHVGDEVHYDFEMTSPDKEGPISPEQYVQMIGAGPKLITNGKLDVDFEKDKMTGSKHTEVRSSRSFIGYNDHFVIMGTASNVLVTDVAHIAIALGLKEAMCLDGGGSSSLYYNGKYLSGPGRDISNALVIKWLENPPIYLNQERLYLDSEAYITQGVSMVPLRGIFERLGANLHWDAKNKKITMNQRDKIIEMAIGSKKVLINGMSKEILMAAEIKNGRAHIPLRFVSEELGANVSWDQKKFRIDLLLP